MASASGSGTLGQASGLDEESERVGAESLDENAALEGEEEGEEELVELTEEGQILHVHSSHAGMGGWGTISDNWPPLRCDSILIHSCCQQ